MLKEQNFSGNSSALGHTETVPCAVGIAIWNNRSLLPGLKQNLSALSTQPRLVLLFDNGSNDDSAGWIAQNWPEAALLKSPVNTGFAEAHNRLIEAAFANPEITAYLALNSDALLDPDFFKSAFSALDPEMKMGAVQPLVLQLDETMKPTGRIDTTGIGFNARTGLFIDRHRGEPPGAAHQTAGPVFGPSGAVALYHRDWLAAVKDPEHGYFDRRFFAYYEDVDISWRARRLGWNAVFIPGAKAYHQRYGSLGARPEQEKLLYRNRLWLHLKNEGWGSLLAPKLAGRELLNLLRAATTRPWLRDVLAEKFRTAVEIGREYDPELEKIDPRDYPA